MLTTDRILGLAAAGVGALVLSACGSSSATPASSAAPTAQGAGSSAAVDASPVSMPATVGDLGPMSTSTVGPSAVRASISERDGRWAQTLTAALTAAYGGAGAGAQVYLDGELLSAVQVMAVRAPTPGLFSTAYAAADLGLAAPTEAVVVVGSVSCLVRYDPTPSGRSPSADATHVSRCQRSSPTLTVIVDPRGPIAGTPDKVAAVVDSAWTSLGGAA